MAQAHGGERVLVTLDKDFGELAIVHGLPHSGIVMLRQDVSTANQLRLLAQEGLALMPPRPPARRKRLLAMHEFFTFLEETYTPILGQWEKRRARQARRREDA